MITEVRTFYSLTELFFFCILYITSRYLIIPSLINLFSFFQLEVSLTKKNN